jgi:hypothetical protein
MPRGANRQRDEGEIEHELDRGCGLDHCEMAAGIFQHHRLVHHGQFQMSGGIVDRDPGVFRDRHKQERNEMLATPLAIGP